MTDLWYIATPYTKYPAGIIAAHEEACRQSAALVRAGINVFCPIAHFHPIAILGGMDPLDYEIWVPANQPFIAAAFGLIVVMMNGWGESKGAAAEIDAFSAAGKPILYMEPGIVPPELTCPATSS